jgi:hypothetical protein
VFVSGAQVWIASWNWPVVLLEETSLKMNGNNFWEIGHTVKLVSSYQNERSREPFQFDKGNEIKMNTYLKAIGTKMAKNCK